MSRRFRLGILCLPALSCILAVAPVGAQVESRPEASGYYNACLKEATSANNVMQSGGRSIYTCWGSAAQSYFDYLVSTNAVENIDKQRTGTYVFRAIPQLGRCWNKIQAVEGISSSSYGCSLNVAKVPN
ncbi:hypothetical protein SAMN05519103_03058 [Rhizobiales bacterium GAS113]|nr:hypothetical protein SAMN05519103_03058 [Rhizobiales bacterium GAS113]